MFVVIVWAVHFNYKYGTFGLYPKKKLFCCLIAVPMYFWKYEDSMHAVLLKPILKMGVAIIIVEKITFCRQGRLKTNVFQKVKFLAFFYIFCLKIFRWFCVVLCVAEGNLLLLLFLCFYCVFIKLYWNILSQCANGQEIEEVEDYSS
ncbi:Protein of unknown function [Gryllus bimaculatus]|nr:Protein of unknown function [Gryllus bimaculatus]